MPADDVSLAIRIRADTQQAVDEMGKFNARLSARSLLDGGVFGLFDGRDAALC